MDEFSDEPTNRQLAYARDLGISVPAGASKHDVSVLIDRAKGSRHGSSPIATERHRKFARFYGIKADASIGKKALFNLIQTELVKPGREVEMVSWFVFRVYRSLVKGAENAPISTPGNAVIQKIAVELAKEAAVVKSVRRYDGVELIWFGDFTTPSGIVYGGASTKTIAYKRAALLLGRYQEPVEPMVSRAAKAVVELLHPLVVDKFSRFYGGEPPIAAQQSPSNQEEHGGLDLSAFELPEIHVKNKIQSIIMFIYRGIVSFVKWSAIVLFSVVVLIFLFGDSV